MARIITPEAILSYPNFFAADEKGKYGTALVFTSGTDLKALKKAAIETAQERWGDKLKGAKIVTLDTQHGPAYFLKAKGITVRLPWRDQDEAVEKKGYPEGCTFLNAKTNSPPQIVSIYPDPQTGKPAQVTDQSKIYPGVIVKASLDPYCYDTDGNKGVTFGLGNIQIIRDGDRLDNRAPADTEFEVDPNATVDLDDLTEEVPVTVGGGEEAEPEDDLSDLLG